MQTSNFVDISRAHGGGHRPLDSLRSRLAQTFNVQSAHTARNSQYLECMQREQKNLRLPKAQYLVCAMRTREAQCVRVGISHGRYRATVKENPSSSPAKRSVCGRESKGFYQLAPQ